MLTKLSGKISNITPTLRHEEEPPNLKQSLKSLLGFLEILYFRLSQFFILELLHFFFRGFDHEYVSKT